MRRFPLPRLFLVVLPATLALPSAASALSTVDWSSTALGTADGITVTLGDLIISELETADLSGSPFEAAPLSANTEVVQFAASADWNLQLSEPVDALLLYAVFWRGNSAGVDPATYHFDVPFEILSGLINAETIGNAGGLTLSLPASQFHDGILLFCGPVSALNVTTNVPSINQSRQSLTLGLAPLPEGAPAVTPVDWTSPAAGAAGAIGATLTNLAGAPELRPVDLGGAAFAAEPLSFCSEAVSYGVESDWELTLSQPAGELLLYARQWRGSTAGGPVTYQFDAPVTIVSGMSGASLSNGDTLLSLPAGFHDGILRFAGPIDGVAVQSSASTGGLQSMTFAVPKLPQVFAWPSASPPCDGTLAACIDQAEPGDVVEIVSVGPHDVGFLTVDKSLTLRAAAGVEPVIAPFGSFFAMPLEPGDRHVRVEGLHFQNGSVRVRQSAADPLEVAIVGNTFDQSPNGDPAVNLSADTSTGLMVVEVADNRIVVPDDDGPTSGMFVGAIGPTSVEGTIRGNRITMGTNTQGSAILVLGSDGEVAIDVFGNVLDGFGYQEGIAVRSQGPGSMALRIADNVVSGTAGEGSREAVQVYASNGAIETLIVNNTLIGNDTAIGIGGRPDLGGSFDGLVANNLIADNQRGLVVDSSAGAIPDRNNLYFANDIDLGTGEDPVTPGPDSIFGMDPLLLVDEDFRPEPGSPVVDAGDTSAVPPDLTTDVAGAPRIRGGIIDIGAHEVPEPGGAAGAAAAGVALAALARRASGARK